MATISELNVRLGLIYKDFEKSLSTVEKRLERSGRKFSQLGNDLALSVSLPLAAIGAAAIQQAGEIEALKLAMVSTFATAGRSVAEANSEIDALRKSALAPGLDFEQAEKGSIRLQGVGYSAEKSRATIEELANAITLAGGTADNLDSVTVQFSQMIAKGKVYTQDLKIIQEAMPKISSLMKTTFGTTNAEALQKMGISGQEFVDKITAAAAVLPRVDGGIKNALVNTAAAARQSLATLGETIVKTFDVKGKLDALSIGLQGVVQWFSSISDAGKSAILQFGLLVFSIGPVVKVVGVLLNAAAAVIPVLQAFIPIIHALGAASGLAAVQFRALSLQMQLTGIGAIIAVVAALAIGINYLASEMTQAEKVATSLNEINTKAAQSIAKEKSVTDLLIAVLKSEKSTREDKLAAMAKLQQISPQYFGSLREENGLIVGLKESYYGYIQNLLKSAKAAAGREKLIEIEGQLLDIDSNRASKQKELIDGARAFGVSKEQALKSENKETNTLIATLTAQKNAIANVVAENEKATVVTKIKTEAELAAEKAAAKAAETDEKAAPKMATALKSVENSIDAVNKKKQVLGEDFIGEKTKEIENGVEKLIEAGFGPNSGPVQRLKGYLRDIRAEIGKGFGSANATQTAVGASPSAPASLPTLALPNQVASVGISGADEAIKKANDLTSAFKGTSQAYQDFADRMNSKQPVFAAAQVIFNELKSGAITWLDALKNLGSQYGQVASNALDSATQIAEGLIQIQKNRGEEEKAALDQEYAAKLESAQGNASQTEALQKELAVKKEEINKRSAKSEQKLAIIQAIINTAIAVSKALGSAAPPLNFVLAGLAAAAGAVQIATIKSQKFAKGGVISKPTLGLVGEYPGAARNPEIITPERLMRSIFREEAGNGGDIRVYGTLDAEGIHIASVMGERRRNRIR